jgi:hypothetical protein
MQKRGSEDRQDGRTLRYQPPAIEERASISGPLNTVALTLQRR